MASFNKFSNNEPPPNKHSSANQRGNPISTLGFMMNMGYPPPAITYETLRKLCSAALDNPEGRITDQHRTTILKEVKARPFAGSTAALFVIQQGLHSSKMERISCALELVHALVDELKVDFAQHINKEFMKSMIQVIKTNSYKDRTVSGSLKKVEKWLTGGSTGTPIQDPRVAALQKRALQIIQIWCDITRHSEYDVSPIHDAYRKLRAQQVVFPRADESFPLFYELNEAYLQTIRGFNNYYSSPQQTGPTTSVVAPGIPGHEGPSPAYDSHRSYSQVTPATDTQIQQLQRAVVLVREQGNSVNHKERTVPVFTRLLPRVVARIDELVAHDRKSTFEEERLLDQLFTLKENMEAVLAELSDDPLKQIMDTRAAVKNSSNPFLVEDPPKKEESIEISPKNTDPEPPKELWPSDEGVDTEQPKEVEEDPFAALNDLLK